MRGMGRFADAQVGLTQAPPARDRLRRVGIESAETRRPRLLVVADDGRPVLGDDHPNARTGDQVGIGQVVDHFARRPLRRPR